MEENKENNEHTGVAENELPKMAEEGIHAGFPAPATGFMEKSIDLNRELIKHPSATFFGRAVGDSMIEAGVSEGDLLVIDRSLEPHDGDMAVCFVDGEFTLKYLSFSDPTGRDGESGMFNHIWLVPANPAYKPIRVSVENDFTVWGVVTYVIKKTK